MWLLIEGGSYSRAAFINFRPIFDSVIHKKNLSTEVWFMKSVLRVINIRSSKKLPCCSRLMPRLSSAMILPRTSKFVPLVIVATPTKSSLRMRAAAIRGRLLFFSLSSRCGYYLRAATIRGAASIQIIRYAHEKTVLCTKFKF